MSDPLIETPYDGKPLAEIIHDFAVIRGDLCEQYAREQLARAVLSSAEVTRLAETRTEKERGILARFGWWL